MAPPQPLVSPQAVVSPRVAGSASRKSSPWHMPQVRHGAATASPQAWHRRREHDRSKREDPRRFAQEHQAIAAVRSPRHRRRARDRRRPKGSGRRSFGEQGRRCNARASAEVRPHLRQIARPDPTGPEYSTYPSKALPAGRRGPRRSPVRARAHAWPKLGMALKMVARSGALMLGATWRAPPAP